MKLIEDWANKTLTCENCGTDKLVRWINDEKVLCQKCIVPDILENNQLSLTDEEMFTT